MYLLVARVADLWDITRLLQLALAVVMALTPHLRAHDATAMHACCYGCRLRDLPEHMMAKLMFGRLFLVMDSPEPQCWDGVWKAVGEQFERLSKGERVH